MNNTNENSAKSPPMKIKENGTRMDGVATLVQFAQCQGVLMAANMRDLRKLARGFFLADFNPELAKKVSLRRGVK